MQLDDADAAARVRRAARRRTGSPGLGLRHRLRARRACPRRCVEAAEELGFPLFEVPYEVPFIAITEKAFTHLVNEHYAVLQRALSAHERLERIVLSERGLDGVAGALPSLIGGPALIFDARGEVLARRAGRAGAADDAVDDAAAPSCASASRERRAPRLRARRRGSRAARWRCRWRARRAPRARRRAAARRRGWSRPRTPAPLTELDRLTLHQAVTIVALELLRRRVADDTERRLAGDVLTALVSRRADGPGAGAPAGAVRAARARRRARARAAAGGPRAAVEEALARARARGGGRRARRPAPAASRARCCRRARRRRRAVRARRARARARWRARPAPTLPAGAGRAVAPGDLRRGVPRGALRAGGARARRRRDGNGARAGAARHLPRPRLLPAAALAAGRRRAAAVLRLDPRPDRGVRGRLRRRADALAGGVHRVQRAVGAGGAPALLSPPHPALPDPPRGGADRPLAGLRARPHRLLARAARARAGPTPNERTDT